MEKGFFVKDFTQAQQQVEGLFVVAGAKAGTASNGKSYWSVELQDATGKVEAKIWDPLSATISELPENSVLWLRGETQIFRGKMQLKLDELRVLDDEARAGVDVGWFVPASPRDVDAMEAELHALCEREFTHPGWRNLVDEILRDGEISMALRIFPAAKSMHHAYAGGLLEHTLGVCKLCLAMCDCYPELDRQTLLAGALCHDIGKIREFSVGLTTDYTDDGRLMGHIIQGLAMLEPMFQRAGLEDGLRQHLIHLILSHHGQRDFGAVAEPQTPEALALHHADNVDAKLAMCRELFAKAGEGENDWSDFHRGLNHAMFRPTRTPVAGPAPVAAPMAAPAVAPKAEAKPEPTPVVEHKAVTKPKAEPKPEPVFEDVPPPFEEIPTSGDMAASDVPWDVEEPVVNAPAVETPVEKTTDAEPVATAAKPEGVQAAEEAEPAAPTEPAPAEPPHPEEAPAPKKRGPTVQALNLLQM